jgi:hypothetical protein
MASVDDYVAGLPAEHAEIARRIRELIKRVAPEARESIKWAQPVYEHHGPFAYFRGFKDYVNFGFWRGAELNDPEKLLTGGGERMAHISVRRAEDLPTAQLEAFVRAAVLLNEAKGNPTRRARA